MKTVPVLVSAGFLCSAVLLAGCAQNCASTTYIPYQSAPVVKVGHGMSSNIQISNVGGLLTDGYMHGRAQLTNLSSDPQGVRYHFMWSSADGSPQGENTPWIPVQIGPHFSEVVQAIAPTQQATQFQLQVCQ